MSIQVIRAGLLTTIQDLGRFGMQKYGVIVSGAMDPVAMRIANALVSNQANAAVLEITQSGPSLQFVQDSLIAISGGDFAVTLGRDAVPAWRPVWIRAGSILDVGSALQGRRAYLAVAGGFAVPESMHSRSTSLRAKIGGHLGRPLQKGDILPIGSASSRANNRMRQMSAVATDQSFLATKWFAGSDIIHYSSDPTIRVIPGSEYDWFTAESRDAFVSKEFVMTPQSDRMGYRLTGSLLQLSKSRELISEAVTVGTIQVPPEGYPIVLMADRPTTGGYPKIACVAAIDLPVLAQLKPGCKIRFQSISVEEAQRLYRTRETIIDRLRCGIDLMAE